MVQLRYYLTVFFFLAAFYQYQCTSSDIDDEKECQYWAEIGECNNSKNKQINQMEFY